LLFSFLFFFVAKLAIHPGEDLAKTGYKPDMKTKNFNHPSTSFIGYKMLSTNYNFFGILYYCFSVTFAD
jgi:hypothetical protein